MKATVINRQAAPAYPNAASRRYFLEKAVDAALVIAIGMGIGTALLFLLVLL